MTPGQWKGALNSARIDARAAADRLAVLAEEAHSAGVPMREILKATGWSRATYYRRIPRQLTIIEPEPVKPKKRAAAPKRTATSR